MQEEAVVLMLELLVVLSHLVELCFQLGQLLFHALHRSLFSLEFKSQLVSVMFLSALLDDCREAFTLSLKMTRCL